MSHTSWSATAPMGSAPPYHLDPSPGGVPVFSPDGRWRWAGDHWELRDDPENDEPASETDPATDPETDPATDQDLTASLD